MAGWLTACQGPNLFDDPFSTIKNNIVLPVPITPRSSPLRCMHGECMRIIIWPVPPHARFHCKTIGKISAWGAYASCRGLLGTRTAPCDAILRDFIALKHPSYLQPEKQMQTTTYEINFLCKFLLLILSKLHLLSAHE